MPRYIVHFNTNPSAWPSDPAQVLATWEAVMAGGSQLLEQGLFDEIGWVGNLEGYGLVEAESNVPSASSSVSFCTCLMARSTAPLRTAR